MHLKTDVHNERGNGARKRRIAHDIFFTATVKKKRKTFPFTCSKAHMSSVQKMNLN